MNKKDYSKMSLDSLRAEHAKLKRNKVRNFIPLGVSSVCFFVSLIVPQIPVSALITFASFTTALLVPFVILNIREGKLISAIQTKLEKLQEQVLNDEKLLNSKGLLNLYEKKVNRRDDLVFLVSRLKEDYSIKTKNFELIKERYGDSASKDSMVKQEVKLNTMKQEIDFINLQIEGLNAWIDVTSKNLGKNAPSAVVIKRNRNRKDKSFAVDLQNPPEFNPEEMQR